MKTANLLIAFLFFVTPVKESTLDAVVNALNRGNANQLSGFFDKNIQLDLGDKKNIYSKSQAELLLKEFFLSNTVKNFELLKMATPKSTVKYCIGKLNTVNGLYQTSICIRQEGDRQLIEEIDFDK